MQKLTARLIATYIWATTSHGHKIEAVAIIAVTSSKIAWDAILPLHITDYAVGSQHLQSNAIQPQHLADGAIPFGYDYETGTISTSSSSWQSTGLAVYDLTFNRVGIMFITFSSEIATIAGENYVYIRVRINNGTS